MPGVGPVATRWLSLSYDFDMDESPNQSPRIEQWLQPAALALLVAIEDRGSLSAGARAVGMAQPNASRTLRTLERRLGYQLVARASTGSKLTSEGKLTVQWAREVLGSMENLWTGAQALATSADEEFSFAASMTIAEHLAPTWIRRLRQADQAVRTRMRVMNSDQVISAVQQRDTALGFVETPQVPEGLVALTVYTDQLVLITPEHHPWVERGTPVTLAELAATALVEREAGSGTRAFLDSYVGTERVTPIVEFNSNSAITHAVAAGLGPAVISRLAIEGSAAHPGFVQLPIAGTALNRPLRAIWEASRPMSAAVARFVEICTSPEP